MERVLAGGILAVDGDAFEAIDCVDCERATKKREREKREREKKKSKRPEGHARFDDCAKRFFFGVPSTCSGLITMRQNQSRLCALYRPTCCDEKRRENEDDKEASQQSGCLERGGRWMRRRMLVSDHDVGSERVENRISNCRTEEIKRERRALICKQKMPNRRNVRR